MTSIGSRIRKLREERCLTQIALAESARVAQSVISDIECGVIKSPTIGVVTKIAKALGVSVAELLEEDDEQEITSA